MRVQATTLYATTFWVVLAVITLIVIWERLPLQLTEGFTSNLVTMGNSQFWSRMVPRRGDVGPEQEQDGLLRDRKYFAGYVDVQRFGAETDFCRFVQQGPDPQNKFLACALGGTENLTSIGFRGPSVKDGFQLSRDDYMRDTNGDGRADYCRILKLGYGQFDIQCNPATDTGFSKNLVTDPDPPKHMATLKRFYDGCVFWLRLRDDMLDYAQTLYVNTAGKAAVDESEPNPVKTKGLLFNGVDQYLRIGDDRYLSFGKELQLRALRAIHVWVKFDEFTNNAHIFDFGNGAGIDNVWMGIQYRGNQDAEGEQSAQSTQSCGAPEKATVPSAPSGAQPHIDMTPQDLMRTSEANVEEWECRGFAVAAKGRKQKKRQTRKAPAKTADMLFEIWDKDQRKLRIKIPSMFTKGEWTHVVITATGKDAFRPDLAVYKNGKHVYTEPSAWLPQASETKKNWIGRSNWEDDTSQYANRDELFKGALFDFRGYTKNLSCEMIEESYAWGRNLLGVDANDGEEN